MRSYGSGRTVCATRGIDVPLAWPCPGTAPPPAPTGARPDRQPRIVAYRGLPGNGKTSDAAARLEQLRAGGVQVGEGVTR